MLSINALRRVIISCEICYLKLNPESELFSADLLTQWEQEIQAYHIIVGLRANICQHFSVLNYLVHCSAFQWMVFYLDLKMWTNKMRPKATHTGFAKLFAESRGWRWLKATWVCWLLVVYMIHAGGFSLVSHGQMHKPLKPLRKLALGIGKVSSLSWEFSTMLHNYLSKSYSQHRIQTGRK